jgi:preprotein translocase SecF subunit
MSRFWPLIKTIPVKTNLEFIGFAKFAAVLSVVAVTGSIFMTVYPFKAPCGGLQCGVDFAGGNVLEVITDPEPIDLEQLRAIVLDLDVGSVDVQGFGAPGTQSTAAMVTFQTPEGMTPDEAVEQVEAAVAEVLGPDTQFNPAAQVGSKVSQELLVGGISALGLAVALMLVYIWFRFEWQFALGAVAGLMHDTILVFGLFAITDMEFSLNAVAAILTVIGYSMNDTVVVFDRMRENLRKYKVMPLRELINLSINETLSRTIITGVTAVLALSILAFFGGPALFPFSVALIFGIIFGTYSSIYVGAPIILLWGVKRGEEEAKPLPVRTR